MPHEHVQRFYSLWSRDQKQRKLNFLLTNKPVKFNLNFEFDNIFRGHKLHVNYYPAVSNLAFFQLFTTRQNFKLVQIESICRRQNKCNLKTEILSAMVRKHGDKRRKCWLQAFSAFPTIF